MLVHLQSIHRKQTSRKANQEIEMGNLDDSAQAIAVHLFDALMYVKRQIDAGLPIEPALIDAALEKASGVPA